MRWQLSRRNEAGEDRRRPWTLFPAVIGGSVLVLLLAAIAMLRGNDLVSVLPLGNSSDAQTDASPPQLDPEDELTDFVAGVMAETQAAWHERFREMGGTYQEPSLVIFSDTPESACNLTQATAGPFYCPADQTVYVDLDFSQDLWSRNDASRDLALAYAIAHEVGHHVQNLLGISQEVQRIQQ
ncbi:MAG: neutral zinc metallopeptidase, partial [Elainellaceae cyanobacterium]